MGEATSEALLSKSPSEHLFHKRGMARGKKPADFLSADEAPAEVEMEGDDGLLRFCTLNFHDAKLEQLYHTQLDRWFIPALAINILFLLLYGLYQVLVMPLLLTNLMLIIASLGIMFIGMLVLYVNFFEVVGGSQLSMLVMEIRSNPSELLPVPDEDIRRPLDLQPPHHSHHIHLRHREHCGELELNYEIFTKQFHFSSRAPRSLNRVSAMWYTTRRSHAPSGC